MSRCPARSSAKTSTVEPFAVPPTLRPTGASTPHRTNRASTRERVTARLRPGARVVKHSRSSCQPLATRSRLTSQIMVQSRSDSRSASQSTYAAPIRAEARAVTGWRRDGDDTPTEEPSVGWGASLALIARLTTS